MTAWTAALPVTHLTVLRAHLLTPQRLQRLIDLRAFTGLHLILVCHRPRLPAAVQRALKTVAHSVAAADDFYGPAAYNSPLPLSAPPRPTAQRWITLSTLDRLASSDGSDHCIGCVPPMIDWKYRHRPAREHPRPPVKSPGGSTRPPHIPASPQPWPPRSSPAPPDSNSTPPA